MFNRMIGTAQRNAPQEDSSAVEKPEELWCDLASELWETKLQYLRGQTYAYSKKATAASELQHHYTAPLEVRPHSEIVKRLTQDESLQRNLLDSSYKSVDHPRALESSVELACMY